MKLMIKADFAREIGTELFVPWGHSADEWTFRGSQSIELSPRYKDAIERFKKALKNNSELRYAKSHLSDIEVWEQLLRGKSPKVKGCKHFCEALKQLLVHTERKHLYWQKEPGIKLALYVEEIEYNPSHRNQNGNWIPESTTFDCFYEEFGTIKSNRFTFHREDCRGMTCLEALAKSKLQPENKFLRESHLEEVKKYSEWHDRVGMQFLASGTGTDEMDGNPKGRSWWNSRVNIINFERDGNPTKCVIDIVKEDPSSREESDDHCSPWFWTRVKEQWTVEEEEERTTDLDLDPPEMEIPVHPYVAIFDLSKHLRCRIHVNNLTPYVYDKTIADKLVLRQELKDFIRLLIHHERSGFEDIVKGKTGGAVVLLSGPPGCGKTLTAEVFAENEGRPLFSVQCSQLGVSPDEIENNLLKAFSRARRWNAVMLLDEADVYVQRRADDLNKNAIVGVFLRVLEYQARVLFLTTNKPKDVDDAIASRCIARISYPVPNAEEQARIWDILSRNSNRPIKEGTIRKIVKGNPGLTGRDVKQLLKLAMLIDPSKPITPKNVEYVQQFRPDVSE